MSFGGFHPSTRAGTIGQSVAFISNRPLHDLHTASNVCKAATSIGRARSFLGSFNGNSLSGVVVNPESDVDRLD